MTPPPPPETLSAIQRLRHAQAGLIMVREFIVQPATDPLAWVDSVERDVNEAIAALRAAPPQAEQRAWLIERHHESAQQYWTGRIIDGKDQGQWSENVNDARRFCRREDAECMLTWHCNGVGRVAEHLWVLPASPPAPPADLVALVRDAQAKYRAIPDNIFRGSDAERVANSERVRVYEAAIDEMLAWTPPPAPPVPEGETWTPEYIAGALAKAYPPQIQPGDVIEFAHGSDAPMFQRLTHPAAVEDWNGKLRDRVRAIYRPIWSARSPEAAPPQATVPDAEPGQCPRCGERDGTHSADCLHWTCDHCGHDREAHRDGAASRLERDGHFHPCRAAQAHGYLSRVFTNFAPQCTALPDLMGICTQIDNLLAGMTPPATPPVPEGEGGWTPEYIASALARAYPPEAAPPARPAQDKD